MPGLRLIESRLGLRRVGRFQPAVFFVGDCDDGAVTELEGERDGRCGLEVSAGEIVGDEGLISHAIQQQAPGVGLAGGGGRERETGVVGKGGPFRATDDIFGILPFPP